MKKNLEILKLIDEIQSKTVITSEIPKKQYEQMLKGTFKIPFITKKEYEQMLKGIFKDLLELKQKLEDEKNLKFFKNNILWIFLHLPKSGGSTFTEHLTKNINPEETLSEGDYSSNKNLKKIIQIKREKIRFIIGHKYFYDIHKFFPEKEPRYITFIRDPAERLVSQYNQDMIPLKSKVIPFNRWYKLQIRNEITLFYDRKSRGIRESRMSIPHFILPLVKKIKPMKSKFKMIALRFITKKLSKAKHDSLQNAKKLLNKCWYIAITENLDDDLKILCKETNISANWQNKNVSGKKGGPKKLLILNKELKDKIYKENPLDFELYEYAKKLNKEKKQNLLENEK